MKRAGWGVLSLWSILYHLNNYELTNREPTEKKVNALRAKRADIEWGSFGLPSPVYSRFHY